MAPMHSGGGNPQPPSSRPQHQKLNPDPIRPSSSHSKLTGCGPHHTYRHLHHQRGTVGTFHVRLLEGKGLSRKHWSALSLGPVKHLGLSKAHGEVSSFGTLRLAFWSGSGGGEASSYEDDGGDMEVGGSVDEVKGKKGSSSVDDYRTSFVSTSSTVTAASSSESSFIGGSRSSAAQSQARVGPAVQQQQQQHRVNFMPSMPSPQQSSIHNNFEATGKSPLTPLFDQGCIRTFSPARSPFFPSYAQQQQQQQQPNNNDQSAISRSGLSSEWDEKPSSKPMQTPPTKKNLPLPPSSATSPSHHSSASRPFGPPPPNHYAKEQFKSSTVHNDSNPIWGDSSSFFNDSSHHNNSNKNDENKSTFRIPLQKDDLLPTLHTDGARIGLEIRLDEEMAGAESLLVGGALSTAVGAATAATSVVGMGRQTQNVSNMGMELLGLSTDRLIGRGYVDLMPLLLGLWEESWELKQHDDDNDHGSCVGGKEQKVENNDDSMLNEYGKINPSSRRMRRRVERMGMLDVWVPLYHPNSAPAKAKGSSSSFTGGKKSMETSGKVHLLISYEPNGMVPQRDDIVAFESFVRRPLHNNTRQDGDTSSSSNTSSCANIGPIITPIVPPLSPLLVVDIRLPYLLLEYATSRTITSVDRSGNVKSSRYERHHRVRIHRNAIFVIERRTLMDAASDLARLPGDIVLSTPIGREVADASAPIVAGAMELMGPALLWGKLMMAAGGTGVRAGLAGARAATEAVVTASQEKALERRGDDERMGDAGVYSYGG